MSWFKFLLVVMPGPTLCLEVAWVYLGFIQPIHRMCGARFLVDKKRDQEIKCIKLNVKTVFFRLITCSFIDIHLNNFCWWRWKLVISFYYFLSPLTLVSLIKRCSKHSHARKFSFFAPHFRHYLRTLLNLRWLWAMKAWFQHTSIMQWKLTMLLCWTYQRNFNS